MEADGEGSAVTASHAVADGEGSAVTALHAVAEGEGIVVTAFLVVAEDANAHRRRNGGEILDAPKTKLLRFSISSPSEFSSLDNGGRRLNQFFFLFPSFFPTSRVVVT